MDTIQLCLSVVPVPYLSVLFSQFRFINSTINGVQTSRQQLRILSACVSQLLITLNAEYSPGKKLLTPSTRATLEHLSSLLKEILAFVQKHAAYSFVKQLFTKDDRIARIDEYHRRIASMVAAFQISALVNAQEWQLRNEHAHAADQSQLSDRLAKLEANQVDLAQALNIRPDSVSPLMVSLQRRLGAEIEEERERHFYSHTLQYLQESSGCHIQFESWMITSLDVEFGLPIGVGGFAKVYQGKWNMTDVALKVFTTQGGVTVSPGAVRREIDTWSKLLHPHILQFLGGNVLDEKPFIVMPFLKNGNARDYIHNNPTCNRQKILYDISLGLTYLHSRNIVHGDLKAMNVLIDDAKKAVLCDFGLSRIKADINTRTTQANASPIIGSRNWMSPERLMGSSPRKPSDVYAFGLMIYEIHANEIPLGHIDYSEYKTLVVDQNVRPEQPDEDEAPQLTDETWDLAERCWVKDHGARPKIDTVCSTMSRLLHPSRHTTTPKVPPPIPRASEPTATERPSRPYDLSTPPITPESTSDDRLPSPPPQATYNGSTPPDPFVPARPSMQYNEVGPSPTATERSSWPYNFSTPSIVPGNARDGSIPTPPPQATRSQSTLPDPFVPARPSMRYNEAGPSSPIETENFPRSSPRQAPPSRSTPPGSLVTYRQIIPTANDTLNGSPAVDEIVSVRDHEAFVAEHMPGLGHDVRDYKVFNWSLHDWKNLNKQLRSPKFECGGHKWRILLFPFGPWSLLPPDAVSLFLDHAGAQEAPEGWHACVQFALVISNVHDPTIYNVSRARHRFTSEQYDWGWKHFRGLKKLKSTQEGHRRPIIEGGSANITAFVRVLEDPTGVLWLT